MSNEVFINAFGKFLPNEPISNDEMEDFLGLIDGKPSRLRSRILKQNGIKQRYYALDRNGEVTHWNYQLAAEAVRDALRHSELSASNVEFLATATSQSDLLAPGF